MPKRKTAKNSKDLHAIAERVQVSRRKLAYLSELNSLLEDLGGHALEASIRVRSHPGELELERLLASVRLLVRAVDSAHGHAYSD